MYSTRMTIDHDLLIDILKAENACLKCLRWEQMPFGLSHIVVVKVFAQGSTRLYVRSIEYGSLSGLHSKILEALPRMFGCEDIVNEICCTQDDLKSLRSHKLIRPRKSDINLSQFASHKLFANNHESASIRSKIVGIVHAFAKTHSNIDHHSNGIPSTWLSSEINNVVRNPCASSTYSLETLNSIARNMQSAAEDEWPYEKQLIFLNCLPSLDNHQCPPSETSRNKTLILARYRDSPRHCLCRDRASSKYTLQQYFNGAEDNDRGIHANIARHQNKRRRLRVSKTPNDVGVITRYNMRLKIRLSEALRNDDLDVWNSVRQTSDLSIHDKIRMELTQRGHVRILKKTDNYLHVVWNSYNEIDGEFTELIFVCLPMW